MDAPDIHILSTGTALPGSPIDNAALARHFHMSGSWEQWIDAFVGTRTRHFGVDLATGKVHCSLTDLGEMAASRALAAAGLEPGNVDLLVMGTATPDMLMPATVNMIADRLGIDEVPTYQLQSGCTGAVQAIDVARQMLLGGQYRNALVIGGDVCTKHLELDADLSTLPPAQLVNFVLFGDGAGAVVLGAEPTPGSAVLRRSFVRLAGLNRPPAQSIDYFGMADRHSDRQEGGEDYKAIEARVPVMAVEILQELLDDLDWKEADIDYLLPPQLSGRMTAKIVDRLAVPGAQEITCVADTGNNGNALPFFQLERTLPRMASGDRALGITVESSKWIKAGFALERP
jgi:3-oxoacyl-[acyl-carrier-protein] synthase-3